MTVLEACFKGKIEITTKKYTEKATGESAGQKRSHEEMETGMAVQEHGEYNVGGEKVCDVGGNNDAELRLPDVVAGPAPRAAVQE